MAQSNGVMVSELRETRIYTLLFQRHTAFPQLSSKQTSNFNRRA